MDLSFIQDSKTENCVWQIVEMSSRGPTAACFAMVIFCVIRKIVCI